MDSREKEMHLVFEESAGELLSYATRQLLGDAHQAEDIVQETLLRCWSKADLADRRLLRPWLFTVARNLIIDTRRRRASRPQEVEAGDYGQLPSPDDSLEHVLTALSVRTALEHLSPAHREVLQVTYLADRTFQDASEVLGVPPGTVKSRVHHALRNLRQNDTWSATKA